MPPESNSYRLAAQEDRCSPRTRLTIPATLRASVSSKPLTLAPNRGAWATTAVSRPSIFTSWV